MIQKCENSDDVKKLITWFFDSLSDNSSSGLQKIFVEFFVFVQEEYPQLTEDLYFVVEDALDNGEFGMGGDWWKNV